MATNDNLTEDSEMAELIEMAFEHQAVPPRPPIEYIAQASPTTDRMNARHRPGTLLQTLPVRLLGGLPVIVVCVLLALAIWPAKSILRVDQVSQPPNVEPTPAVPLPLAIREDDADEPKSDSMKVNGPDSEAVITLRLFNSLIDGRNVGVDRLAKRLSAYLDFPPESIAGGFSKMETPAGIKSVSNSVSKKWEWVHGESHTVFVYHTDFSRLINDLDRFVGGVLEERLLFPMLDSIWKDPNGPKIDLRGDLFAHFSDRIIVVVNQSPQPTGDQLMIVIPLKHSVGVANVIQQIASHEPDANITREDRGVIMTLPYRDGRENATCVAQDCLLMGDLSMVRSALDRRQPIPVN